MLREPQTIKTNANATFIYMWMPAPGCLFTLLQRKKREHFVARFSTQTRCHYLL